MRVQASQLRQDIVGVRVWGYVTSSVPPFPILDPVRSADVVFSIKDGDFPLPSGVRDETSLE